MIGRGAYPVVLDERATLEAVFGGMSLARYGDGELKIALGRDAKSQAGDPVLAKRLSSILSTPSERCLVCIPNIGDDWTPKLEFWRQYRGRPYSKLYTRGPYGSSFITRPDSAPWIDTPGYWKRVVEIWHGQDVVLVRGSSKSLTAADLVGVKSVKEIVASRQHAWADYGRLMAELVDEKRRVLLCLGATATVLAFDLAELGVQALDLGHIGMFLRKEGRFDRESFPT